MAQSLAVVLLPRPGAIDATLASVRSEIDGRSPFSLLRRRTVAPEESPAFVARRHKRYWPRPTCWPSPVPETAGVPERLLHGCVRWAHIHAMLGVASYVLMDRASAKVRVTHAPMPPIDANELLVHPSIEPAAVLVRSSALDETALELIASPYGDAAVWSEIVRRYGLLPSGEIAAEVALDPDRHGHDPTMRTKALLAALHAGKTSEEPGQARLDASFSVASTSSPSTIRG